MRSCDLEPDNFIALTPIDIKPIDLYLLCHREPLYKVWAAPFSVLNIFKKFKNYFLEENKESKKGGPTDTPEHWDQAFIQEWT